MRASCRVVKTEPGSCPCSLVWAMHARDLPHGESHFWRHTHPIARLPAASQPRNRTLMPPWKSVTAVCSNRRDDEPSPLGETANASSQNLASMVQKRRSLWKRDSALEPVSCCATLRQIDEDRQAQARVLSLLSSAGPLFILQPIVCVFV